METRNFQAGAAAAPPTAPASPSVGYATNGNPATATPATQPGEFWFHKIGEELRAILTDRGVTPSDSALTQLSSALMNSVVGESINLSMTVAAASATATLTADELVVKSALGLGSKVLASFSKTINLATTGAGGMDTGTAPVSGFVALYAIYNPTTGISALLATNATAAAAPEVYGGANMPAGYTMSALVSVWRTNASSQFVIGIQKNRTITTFPITLLNASSPPTIYTSVSLVGTVPYNTKKISGELIYNATSASASYNGVSIASDSNGTNRNTVAGSQTSAGVQFGSQGLFSLTISGMVIFYLAFPNGLSAANLTITACEYSI